MIPVRVKLAQPTRLVLSATLLFLSAGGMACNQRRARLDALLSAAEPHVASIKEASLALLAAVGEQRDPAKQENPWPAPAQIRVGLNSKHYEIDRSPSAQSLSGMLRDQGAAGFTGIGGDRWFDHATPVPGGMKQLVPDTISVKMEGSGSELLLDPETTVKLLDATGKLQVRFEKTSGTLQAIGNSRALEPDRSHIATFCDEGARAAREIGDRAKGILAAQERSAGGVKPDEQSVTTLVRSVWQAGARAHESAVEISKTVGRLALERK